MGERPFAPQEGLEFIRNRLLQRALGEGANQPADNPPQEKPEAQAEPQLQGRQQFLQPAETAAGRSQDLSFLRIPLGAAAPQATRPPAPGMPNNGAAPPQKPGCKQKPAQAGGAAPEAQPMPGVPMNNLPVQGQPEAQDTQQRPGRQMFLQPAETAAGRMQDLAFLRMPMGAAAPQAKQPDPLAPAANSDDKNGGIAAQKPRCKQPPGQAGGAMPGEQPMAGLPAAPNADAAPAAQPVMPANMMAFGANLLKEAMAALGGGQQAFKDSARMEAVGSVDELNSFIGLALAQGLCPRLMEALPLIQRELIQLASNLAFTEEEGQRYQVQKIDAGQVARLENLTDELGQKVGPLANFILPGGVPGAAQLHVARAVSLRAERAVAALARLQTQGAFVQPYLCQLSQALFAMARYENHCHNAPETVVEGSGGQTKDRPPRCC